MHLFGNLAPIAALLELGLPVLEDSAQATGATLDGAQAGALGSVATFSFYPSKNLPCLGDGGAITTNDDDVAERARILRFHGSKDKRTYTEVGYNSRLDELQAAVLRVLLPELDGWNAARRARRGRLRAPRPRRARRAAPAGARRRARAPPLRRAPRARGRARRPRSPSAASRPAATTASRSTASRRWRPTLELPGTEQAARTHLALPMGTQLTDEQVREVVDACASGST